MNGASASRYLVALGSNRRRHRVGSPREVVAAAMEELAALGTVTARSPVIDTAPLGPAQRRFANAAAIVETELDPEAMLSALKRMEREFGRRSGQRWGDRVLDCDLILWSEGHWQSDRLAVPHPEFRRRDFVLGPAHTIAGEWRDPISGATVAQLFARLTRPRRVPS
ncbi:2-amino-4-hydroxy-6-hydroxymethyldihydropteridine diphosphokinase [Altererythrobacter arenosus]|uniref:2-amino-4-hydroxy-6-hydroxymethyldihydropteridine pyrophosphokinase n=1 Tax=Altererythrobacter arenosus TaxID=3032592 RepID=A0ABY8FVM2_9SPHN|nr:2-amino-4-hydroxy-6-hydroxymethyldihydropteridine diphosphokinase [Altererythrobacter sp. CAU 1644]WFL78295.1 2-amino-4-hydroxy-6-hydroxymethyldihydropteridine diphosphokinase [Altererythrobacter sp. CAU 1644]